MWFLWIHLGPTPRTHDGRLGGQILRILWQSHFGANLHTHSEPVWNQFPVWVNQILATVKHWNNFGIAKRGSSYKIQRFQRILYGKAIIPGNYWVVIPWPNQREEAASVLSPSGIGFSNEVMPRVLGRGFSRERIHIPPNGQSKIFDSKMPVGRGYVSSPEGMNHPWKKTNIYFNLFS